MELHALVDKIATYEAVQATRWLRMLELEALLRTERLAFAGNHIGAVDFHSRFETIMSEWRAVNVEWRDARDGAKELVREMERMFA